MVRCVARISGVTDVGGLRSGRSETRRGVIVCLVAARGGKDSSKGELLTSPFAIEIIRESVAA